MPTSMLRVFSGSCLSLDDHDYAMPRLVARKHVLGSGEDLFDESGRPRQPQPRTLTKVFSGSALDLNAQGESDSEVIASNGVSPAVRPSDRGAFFNDFVDHVDRRDGAARNSRTTVLVIGGAGYLASHIIEQLLRDGFQVKATVPDMRDVAKVHDLYNMVPEAKHMLFVVEANVLDPRSLRTHINGCRFVIHCGVPPAPSNQVIEQHHNAIHALFDAVRSSDVSRGNRVQRVVLTAAYTNVLSGTHKCANTVDGRFDETQWNEGARRATDPVAFARVSFEKEAARLAKMCGIELVVLLPAIMIGPTRTIEVSEAMRTITDFAMCSPAFPIAPNIYWNFVDVRDVATAHVKALTAPQANGERYIITNSMLQLAELGRLIRQNFPHLKAPIYTAPTIVSLAIGPWAHARASIGYLWRTLGVKRELNGSKAVASLDLKLTDMSQTVHDAVASLIQEHYLPNGEGADATGSNGWKRGALCGAVFLAGAIVIGVCANKLRR